MLQSILDCVALSQLSLLRSNQSTTALLPYYCAWLCEVSVSFWWRAMGRKHSKLRPCMTLRLFSNRLCMFELLCCAWWCFGEAEGKTPRIIKDSRTPDVGGFAWLWSWGTFSYTIRWYLLFDWETRFVPVCWVYISFSRQEHSFSDKSLETDNFSLQNHVRHGLWGWTMDLTWFASVGKIHHVGNVDSLGLNLESSGMNSVLLRSRVVPICYFHILIS